VAMSVARLRNLLFELRPRVLDREGLAPALRSYLEEVGRDGGLTCRLRNDMRSDPPSETRTILYRIALEALVNVRKHAVASRVDVSLEERDGGYFVRIRDDGRGFSPDGPSVPLSGHLGLTAMRERAELAGGWWTAASRPGEGTLIEFWVPACPAPDPAVQTDLDARIPVA
jgi:signal transduction histidine kinase